MKYLVMLLVALLAWWLWRGLFRNRVSDDKPAPGLGGAASTASANSANAQETMVACAFCQLHLPRSEAVWSGPTPFCTPAHQQQHESGRTGR
ncbi:MAG: PP0621 family protein [Burkholderiales bacterium]